MTTLDSAAYLSTPTISLGGQENGDAGNQLQSLTVEQTVVGMSWCEARFGNYGVRNGTPDYLYLGRDVFDFGTRLTVTVGPSDDRAQIFDGVISALQADYPLGEPAQLLTFAEDGLQNLRLTRRTRSFDDSSTSDIAQQIASDHGLTPSVDLDGPTRRATAQLNQSDLAFLRSLARRDDGEVWLDGRTLHVASRARRTTGDPIELRYGGDLMSFSVRADLADQATDVAISGWSVADKDAIDETAGADVLGSELGTDTSGSDVLASAFAERHDRMVRTTPLAADDARALAKAAYLERARRFVCGTGMTGGTARLAVGTQVNVLGVGALFEGTYYVSRTRHMFDLVLGFRTEFDVERAGIGSTQ
jgi:phage protein D